MLIPETIQELECEYRQIYSTLPTSWAEQSISDRIRRSLSWLLRSAYLPSDDKPPRIIELWVALNALYGVVTYKQQNIPNLKITKNETVYFKEFLQRLSMLDTNKQLSQLIKDAKFKEISLSIIENKYLWNEFWRNDATTYKINVAKELEKAKKNLNCSPPKYIPFLVSLFERLSTLRNQIMHGSSSASTDRNKDALIPGIYVLETMIPIFIRILIQVGEKVDWPDVPYPRKGSPQHPK